MSKKKRQKGLFEEVALVKKYTKFNIFDSYGRNRVVVSEKPLTTEEAMNHFNALAAGGVE